MRRWIYVLFAFVGVSTLTLAWRWPLNARPHAATDIVPIHNLQYTADATGASPYVGQIVTTKGVVAACDPLGYVIVEPSGGPWRGLYIYDPNHAPRPGDELCLTGVITEYYGLTELGNLSGYAVLTHTATLPSPQSLTAVDLADASVAESYESVLAQLGAVTITQRDAGAGEWVVTDATGASCRIGAYYDVAFLPIDGLPLTSITGVMRYAYDHWALCPRDDRDLEWSRGLYALGGTIVTPDVVYEHGYVTISPPYIAQVEAAPAPGAHVIETDGLIYPGLVNAHDHPSYNLYDRITFGRLFANRYQWYSHPAYWSIADELDALRDAGQTANLWKWGELRHLIAGTTTVQGARYSEGWDAYAHPLALIHNAERLNPHIRNEVRPLDLSEASRLALRQGIDSGRYQRIIVHLSEGVDAASLSEFYTWRDWGFVDGSAAIVHGVPLGESEFAQMAQVGARLIWSPQSNLWLYGRTADIPAALRQGVSVSLATDWTLSGSYNLLDELRVAATLNAEEYGGLLTARDLVEMVTTIPAEHLGLEQTVGRLSPGYLADLMVVRGDRAAPYEALLTAELTDVALTVVSGRALYGDPGLMAALPVAGSVDEPLVICNTPKVLRLAYDAPWIEGANDTLAQITAGLGQAQPAPLPLDLCSVRGWAVLPLVCDPCRDADY